MADDNYKDILNIDMSNPLEVRKALEKISKQATSGNGKIKSKNSNIDSKPKAEIKKRYKEAPRKTSSHVSNEKQKSSKNEKNSTDELNEIKNIDISNPLAVRKALEKISKQATSSNREIKSKNSSVQFKPKVEIKKRYKEAPKKTSTHAFLSRKEPAKVKKYEWENIQEIQKAKPEEKTKFLSLKKVFAIALAAGAISGGLSYHYMSKALEKANQRLEENAKENERKQYYLSLGKYNTDYYNNESTTINNYKDYGDR